MPLFGKNIKRIKLNGSGFGANGPTLVFRTDLSGSTVGNYWTTTDYEGDGTIALADAEAWPIEAVSDMPGGRAIALGASGSAQNDTTVGHVQVTAASASSHVYEHICMAWPAAHQTNAQADLDGSATWQMKLLWHAYDVWDNDDKIKWYRSFGAYNNGLGYMNPGNSIVGSDGGSPVAGLFDGGSSDSPGWTTTSIDYDPKSTSPNYLRPSPFIHQTMVKHASDTTGGYTMYTRNHTETLTDKFVVSGVVCHMDNPTPAHDGPDRFQFPGFIRGYKTQDDQHAYANDIYVAHGAGAWARVEITNNATYDSATIISPATIVSWSDTEIVADIKKGAFSWLDGEETYPTLYITVHDADNTHISTNTYVPWWNTSF